jgi:hypothetical protein
MIHYNHFCLNSKQILVLILVSPTSATHFPFKKTSVCYFFFLALCTTQASHLLHLHARFTCPC